MVILGLGSNTGDRLSYLNAAVKELSKILRNVRVSRVLESKALLLPDSPPEWDKPFLNMAVMGDTDLGPGGIFVAIKKIEKDFGRVSEGTWSPRVIDIDILAMDDQVQRTADLIIPHRDLLNRDFALMPLAELAPKWKFPVKGPFFGWEAAEIVKFKNFTLNDNLRDMGTVVHAP